MSGIAISIHRHRGVELVVSQVDSQRWLVSWKFPAEGEAIHVYRPSQSQALSHAKQQIDQRLNPLPHTPQVIWRSGEDWWSGEEIENGLMPSDAVPYGLIDDEWQSLN